MDISIQIEGMAGLTWPRWERLVSAAEDLGFAGVFRSDHFTLTEPPDLDSLEMVVSLTYLATHSRRVHFGPLVAPLSFRDPIMLARQAIAIDDLSGGRMILGVGAGWMEREHAVFGYPLGDVATRFARLEEGLEVISRLIRSTEPFSFEGAFYRLQEAQLLPRPHRSTPILVGGNGPKRTLPLAARFADIWNCVGATPELFAERSILLDQLAREHGRQPGDIKRTAMLPVLCWRDSVDRGRRLTHLCGANAPFSGVPMDDVVDLFRNYMAGVFGTPEHVVEKLQAYAAAGVEEIMMAWWGMDDVEGLETLATHVISHLSA
jgi:alkanesulfonate monooxygenase SsuD/methylene tetrahydromethanopterin reductase-like flavin-dependent oxidoreductase (luciferase family)